MLLSKEELLFIENHINDDIRLLALQASKYPGIDLAEAVRQIAARQTARNKLPLWYNTKGIVYPHHLSMEQCSSQAAAEYKASLVGGDSFVDLTAGLGVDFSFIASKFKVAHYVERQELLCKLAYNNFPLLGIDNVSIHNEDGIEYLKETGLVDLIFIDPARRDENGGKTVSISDCEPDICKIEDMLVDKAHKVMVKLSPMLDISSALRELKHITEIHIFSLNNECKELLLILKKNTSAPDIAVSCVNVMNSGECSKYSFYLQQENCLQPVIAHQMEEYLYEPNPSVMKGGGYKSLTHSFDVRKLNNSTHLYTSSKLIEEFPGRKFRIVDVSGFGKKELKEFLKNIEKGNITIRNFPSTVAELRKRLKLKDGGEDYLFATTLWDDSKVIIKCIKA